MQPQLLTIDSSARQTRSVTRQLTQHFAERWKSLHPGGEIITRDVGLVPPPPIDESWIAAAFSGAAPSPEGPLAISETLIDELFRATAVVIGVPMYNFGMPAQLKAYIDQIVRVGRTFDFAPGAANPYVPLIPSKPVIVITSAGAGGYEPGGSSAHLNFLEPHLEAVLRFLGLTELTFVRVGYEEFHDERFAASISAAKSSLDGILARA
jgi:FMN-dependent NADH-azoreductase